MIGLPDGQKSFYRFDTQAYDEQTDTAWLHRPQYARSAGKKSKLNGSVHAVTLRKMLLFVSQEMCEQNRAERAENRLSRGRAVNGHFQKMPERGWGAESGYGSGSANCYMGFPADKSATQSLLTYAISLI